MRELKKHLALQNLLQLVSTCQGYRYVVTITMALPFTRYTQREKVHGTISTIHRLPMAFNELMSNLGNQVGIHEHKKAK
jgi:hypothetical protein